MLFQRLTVVIAIAACGGPTTTPPTSDSPATPAKAPPKFAARAGDTVFVNVTVVPMHGDAAVLPDHVVVVRGGTIVAVQPAGAVEVPATVTTIDGKGGFLMPGLADMHVHTWAASDMTLFIAAGVTTVRNMFGAPMHLEMRSEIAAGKADGPTLITAGPIIDGDPPVWPGSTVLTRPEEADAIVAEQKAAGYDFLKVYSRLSAEAYRAIAAAAGKHSMVFAGHVPVAIPLTEALGSGQRSIEHLEGYLPAVVADQPKPPKNQAWIAGMLFRAEHVDGAKLDAIAARTAASPVWNCPTLVVWDRIGRMKDPDQLRKQIRWVEYVSPQMLAFWDPKADFRLKGLTDDQLTRFAKVTEAQRRIVRAIVDAGGKLLVGTDTNNPYVVPGAALHDEIELLIAAGVPRAVVLRAATAGAAEYLDQVGAFGVVVQGARADLILTPTDPLDGPIEIPPAGVMVRGVWHDQTSLQAGLDAARQ